MSQEFEDRFLGVIRHQLQGLSNKVTNDFSKENFDNELASLQTDPVMKSLHLIEQNMY